MNLGKGWIIIEESIHKGNKFVSVISPRRSGRYVQQYMEQMYVDRFTSIEEKIAYKKKPESWPYRANNTQGLYSGIIDCGHDPILRAFYCHKLILKNNILTYTYKTLKGQTDDLRPIFGEITHSINVT